MGHHFPLTLALWNNRKDLNILSLQQFHTCAFYFSNFHLIAPIFPFPLIETPILLGSLSPALMCFWVCGTELLMWEWVGHHSLENVLLFSGYAPGEANLRTSIFRLISPSIACIITMLRLSPLFYQSLPCLFCDSCQSFMLRVWLLNAPRKLLVAWTSLGLSNVSYENFYLQPSFGTQDF